MRASGRSAGRPHRGGGRRAGRTPQGDVEESPGRSACESRPDTSPHHHSRTRTKMTPPTRREARLQRETDGTRQKLTTRRRVGIIVGAVVVALLACAVWIGFKALSVKGSLESAQSALAAAQSGGDIPEAIEALSADAGDAAAAANDPLWRAAEIVPFLGDNLRAVRVVSETLDAVANDVGGPIFALQSDGEGALLRRALPMLEAQTPRLQSLAGEVSALSDNTALVGPVADGVAQVDEVLTAIGPTLDILPSLLGADGAKNYLLVFQNNAETLALGGSAASETMIRADNGDLAITGQASSAIFDRDTRSIGVEIPEGTQAIHGPNYGKRVNLSTSRPDWPGAAQMVAAFWNRTIDDTTIDGAISIDPIALSRILLATGPITVPGPDGPFELNSENAVDVLLSKSYEWWDAYTPAGAKASDAFFATVASSVFTAISSGNVNMKDMVWAITESAQQGSVYAWMADDKAQTMIENAGRIAGILPRDNSDTTTIGIYPRDVSASKIDYYLDATVGATMSCADGETRVTGTATLKLDLSQEQADSLPDYVKSFDNGSDFFSKHVFIYAPPGMELESVDMQGDRVSTFREGNDDLGRVVAPFQARLSPGESMTVTATFVGTGDFGPLDVRTTPTVRGTDVTVDDTCR
ncbi:DUF4012 domain-containing protein [Microbacterium sp. EYE_5]|uniref:DUF4012 domain-containing protein n=1 Tax=unclassified Microbacterium TaxID=2609290 RepID=UPI002006A640|nr:MULTISPECIES: DUF4012 domain-containing protein [unclassified Microbacterium]MCK6079105.1 DUF4012 domain-containing protein [Microbacterium sp. EYE_382]MCK6084375.1 DUF4012 domain-containing protein [Microbacterium sp. EYE_384]MCK6123396.1 DUF4012 domain-containing protein [Microbacterium sp. EYE_80]MCK6125139.1 DUF4012 domain-containing protein [Microbacterium sp. EYE_79]MCK6140059.1 DUF4012 domain-containing protein [Microbacterium sp. EYE_39]